MKTIIENAFVERLAESLPRSPLQLNALRESDAELVRLPGTDILLALTTDGIVEEIEAGLYADPYLIGWMAVIVNASDLAAVGADPIGILVNETLPEDLREDLIAEIQHGIHDACVACQLDVLGGDTNFCPHMQVAGTALGVIPDGAPLTRRGCKIGDRLFASGPLGQGSAFALARMLENTGKQVQPIEYQPRARLREGRLLRGFASSCMDTSDGALATLDELMRLNDVGFVMTRPIASILHRDALRMSQTASLPAWTMLAGPHGEFELLFTVPAACCGEFLRAASSLDWAPVELGSVVSASGLFLDGFGEGATIDTGLVRNLFLEVRGDVQAFIAGLLSLDPAHGIAR